MAISNDSLLVVYQTSSNAIFVDPLTARIVRSITPSERRGNLLRWASDGQHLLMSMGHVINRWDTMTGEATEVFRADAQVVAFEVAPDTATVSLAISHSWSISKLKVHAADGATQCAFDLGVGLFNQDDGALIRPSLGGGRPATARPSTARLSSLLD